jgi:hypothetical protein
MRSSRCTQGDGDGELRMLLFDAFHDDYRGVVCLAVVVDGRVARGDRVTAASTGETYELLEVCADAVRLTLGESRDRVCLGVFGQFLGFRVKKTLNSKTNGETWRLPRRTREAVTPRGRACSGSNAAAGAQSSECRMPLRLPPRLMKECCTLLAPLQEQRSETSEGGLEAPQFRGAHDKTPLTPPGVRVATAPK